MRPPWLDKLEKLGFVLGFAALAFLYGFATNQFGWPGAEFLQRAWLQGSAANRPPDFTEPRAYNRQGVRLVRPDEMAPGVTLISSVWPGPDGEEWRPGLRIVDREGRDLHRWSLDPGAVFPDSVNRRNLGFDQLDFQGSYVFPDGDVLVNIEYAGTARLDACGEVVWSLPSGGHHSIDRADDGTFWIPGVTRERAVGSPRYPRGYPGLQRPSFNDHVLRVTPDGEIVQRITLLDVIYGNGLQRLLFKFGSHTLEDVTHLNDIEALSAEMADEYPLFEAGDLVLSLKGQDLVMVMDPESGRVKWHATEHFIEQHDPDLIGDGWIGVFDNNSDTSFRGNFLGGSRIVAVQPHTDSVRVLFPTEHSDPFYTWQRGKWQLLENGNMMLTESVAGRVVEVTPEGRTVWEWIAPPFSETRTPYVSKGARLDLSPETVAGWPCSPTSTSDDAGADR